MLGRKKNIKTSHGAEDKKQADFKLGVLFSVSLVLALVGRVGYGIWISDEDMLCVYPTTGLLNSQTWYLMLHSCLVHDRSAKLYTSAT